MQVRKRSGNFESVNLEKITSSIKRVCTNLNDVDYYKVAVKTVGGLYDGVSTKELDELSIQTAVGFISSDPIYSKVASRLLSNYVEKEVQDNEIFSFTQSIEIGHKQGLISDATLEFVKSSKRKLNNAIKHERNSLFEYYGLRIVYDRYLLRHPLLRGVLENPQYWFLRVACGLANDVKEAIQFYDLISSLEYLPSTPTLFNSGTTHPQMSSCYILDSPKDNLEDIYKRYSDIARLSKWAGGIGLNYSKIRGAGALIKGTNGKSNGIVPWLHTLDSSVEAVNQGGKRKGAAAVYLETHHPDIMEFLEMKDITGDHEKRGHNLNYAVWISDLFMNRVINDEQWSLFDPTVASDLTDLFGDEYENRYIELELEEKFVKQLPARKIYARLMRSLAETGNFWPCFKDTSNKRGNTAVDGNIIRSSNLCTEILEPTSEFETAVCNLSSINIGAYVKDDGTLDKLKLRKNITLGMKFLDRVIDKNFYPIEEASTSNLRWRPVGLGLMGLQDLFFKLNLPFDSDEAIALSAEIQEEIYYQALKTSNELAQEFKPHRDWKKTHAAKGKLQFDLAEFDAISELNLKIDALEEELTDNIKMLKTAGGDVIGIGMSSTKTDFEKDTIRERIITYKKQIIQAQKNKERWNELKIDIKKHGLRNSLVIAIAPTVTISAIAGCYECIEPQNSNIFKRETLSGEFVNMNKYLVEKLKDLDLWSDEIIEKIKINDGSIQTILEIPKDIRDVFKTVWEISNKTLIKHAVARGVYIDQSQSLNLFMENATIPKLSSLYKFAWEQGLKTTYYLRSKSATKIQKLSPMDRSSASDGIVQTAPENPEICESCT